MPGTPVPLMRSCPDLCLRCRLGLRLQFFVDGFSWDAILLVVPGSAEIKMSRESPAKCWCFTVFPEDDTDSMHEWLQYQWNSGAWTYLVGQVEVAPETGRYHLQAFGVLGSKKRLTQLKKIDGRAHWERMQGTPAQAKAYCTKQETRVEGPWEFGELKSAGRPATLEEVAKVVKTGATDEEIAEDFGVLWIRHYKGIRSLRMALKITGPQRDWEPEIWVLWGPSRTGKSAFAHVNWPDAYWKDFGEPWWDNYAGQETIVIDDMRPGYMPLTTAQHLLDRYPMHLPVKGAYVECLARRIVITTNLRPDEWYEKDVHHTILGRINDYAQGRYVWCPHGPWTDAWTNQPWEPQAPYVIPDFIRNSWVVPGSGFSGNTRENPDPSPDAWEELARTD